MVPNLRVVVVVPLLLAEDLLDGGNDPADHLGRLDGVAVGAGARLGQGRQTPARAGRPARCRIRQAGDTTVPALTRTRALKTTKCHGIGKLAGSQLVVICTWSPPQVGILNLSAARCATSFTRKVSPLGQVQRSGVAPRVRRHGLLLYSIEKAIVSPSVHWQEAGGAPSHGLRSLVRIRCWITGLLRIALRMLLAMSPRPPPPPSALAAPPPPFSSPPSRLPKSCGLLQAGHARQTATQREVPSRGIWESEC